MSGEAKREAGSDGASPYPELRPTAPGTTPAGQSLAVRRSEGAKHIHNVGCIVSITKLILTIRPDRILP